MNVVYRYGKLKKVITWLKLKKYAPKILIVGTELKLTLIFKYYSMEKADKLLQGYYVMTKSED